MSIKKNFFAPSSKGLGATRRAAMLLLIALLAAQTAWAEDIATYYLDKDGTRYDVNATVLTGSEDILGSYGQTTWYVVNSDIEYTDVWLTCYGDINLILADGTTMTANNSNGNAISGPFGSLTIYGQTLGTGTLDATGDISYSGGDIIINGGIVKATSTGGSAISSSENLTINGGTVDAKGKYGLDVGNVTINGGNVTATGLDSGQGISASAEGTITINGGIVDAKGGSGLYAPNITINGGNVTATGLDSGQGISANTEGTITLGWTRASDFIQANSYSGTVSVKGSLAFLTDDATPVTISGNNIDPASINGKKLTPDLSSGLIENGDTYIITNTTGWNVFCDRLEGGETFSGKTVALGADITVSRMAGGQPFTGTFDGAGHTLTLAYGTADAPVNQQFVAPFVEVADAAKFTDLTIAGSIHAAYTGSAEPGVGGLIGHLFGGVTIEGCTSTVEITSTRDRVGGFVGLCEHSVSFTDCVSSAVVHYSRAGNISGFVGWSRASEYTISFEGCLFNGKLLLDNGQWYGGGFVGWKGDGKTVNITNCLYAPPIAADEKYESGGATFCSQHNDKNPAVITNCYYTHTLGAAQGKARHTVTAGTDVTIEAIALTGDATQYTVSGITAYSGGGLQRGENLYYGIDDVVSLTLSNTATGAPDGYQYGYTTNAGTLEGSTLTMPAADVTVSVNTDVLVAIDWATVNQGDSAEDPYMIYNKDQLLLLAHRVNGTNDETANDYLGKYFKLGADITFDHPVAEPDNYAENYEAIGGYIGGTYRNFKGNFDGDGHTVSGIRIRKTGSGIDYIYQGLFGRIESGAEIHDVHLTDARIIGYLNVGGIAGFNDRGYIMRCSVTDSYITAVNYYGTICGRNDYTYSLRNNYYHGCTVNGTPVTSGMGCNGADITANHGALPAYRLALGANITTPPGTFAGQTVWLDTPPVGARLAPENGFTLAGNHYFASGYVFTPGSTLASGAAQGYTPRATLGSQLLDLYTHTGDAPDYTGTAIARLTITADCDGKTLSAALRSDGQPVTVAYIKADGTTGEASAIALDGHEAVDEEGDVHLAAGTYYVGTDITYANQIRPDGDITLILADGKTMTLNGNTQGIFNISSNLTIYGQSLDTATAGTLRYNGSSLGPRLAGINVSNYEQHSGNVSITTKGYSGYGIFAKVTLRGGTLTISASGTSARAINGTTHSILGGQLTATATGTNATGIDAYVSGTALTLGWTRPADRITASSISTYGGTVAVADGQALTDGSGHIYTGTLSAADLDAIAALGGKTLRPCLALADAADNTAAITDHAGQTLAVALAGRTLYKDGAWNTLCLPFSVSTASGTLSGDNVQAMTLNTETSNLTGSTLTLNFDVATGQTIPAGTPFIIKWDNTGVNITNPVFEGVTVSNATAGSVTSNDGRVQFLGTYSPTDIYSAEKDNLYLGAANKLYWPWGDGMTEYYVNAFRAYFHVNGAASVRQFVLNFGFGDEATGIISIHNSQCTIHNEAGAWYTLDGRKLQAQPTKSGLYIHGGKKVGIK